MPEVIGLYVFLVDCESQVGVVSFKLYIQERQGSLVLHFDGALYRGILVINGRLKNSSWDFMFHGTTKQMHYLHNATGCPV